MTRIAGTAVVYGNNTTTERFVPITGALPGNTLTECRAQFDLSSTNGNVKVRPAVQYSNDGYDWTATSAIGDWSSALDQELYSSWVDQSSAAAVYVRVGFLCVGLSSPTPPTTAGIVRAVVETRLV
ncbi:MAG: hypothetical protein R3F61_02575 [Myxococcota bacterium]